MNAIVCTHYGPPEVLQLKELAKPTPGDRDILIKICATAVTASDCIVRGFNIPAWKPMGFMMGLMLGFDKPRNPVLGMVLAGEVETAGRAVTRFKPGDQVYALHIMHFGAYAEYMCLPESEVIAPKPSSLTCEEAAAIPYGGLLALHFLRKGGIQRGQKVLIYGASGAIGTSAVQLARHFGAEVSAVASTTNLDLVKSLGAATVIDYTRQDFLTRPERYDLVLNAVGKRKAMLECAAVLSPGGKYITVDDGRPILRREDLALLTTLAESGELKPVIDRTYPLAQMAEAHRYVDAGHKRGNVVITVAHPA